MTLGEHILILRKKHNLSQAVLGKLADASGDIIGRYERDMTPSIEVIMKIADALGVSMAELFYDNDSLREVSSMDKTLMERVSLIDSLTKEEQKTLFTVLDAFVAKRKFKSTLKTVLQDIE